MGFKVSTGQLVDGNGVAFVIRGINYPYAWYTTRHPVDTSQDFANVRATHANSIRLVLGTGAQYLRTSGSEISELIALCKRNSLVAILEVHDCTGFGDTQDAPNAVPISQAVSYWLSPDVLDAIRGQEDFVIVNIANEPFGNNTSASASEDSVAAIVRLRDAGLRHTLMIDAANWGQDWSGTTRKAAATIFTSDRLRNTLISVHMYETYDGAIAVSRYIAAYRKAEIPLVIGEFGPSHHGTDVDAANIMSQAQRHRIGYLGWSWSGNNPVHSALNIVPDFGPSLTVWGNTLVNGSNGIRATSIRASVFGGLDRG